MCKFANAEKKNKNKKKTGKLHVILLSAERNCTCTLFGRCNRDAFWEKEVKIHETESVKELLS